MADIPILSLNDRWRVAHDGQLQWILQKREGGSWYGKLFPCSRSSLVRSIAERCGDLDIDVLATIEEWPERYRDWLAEHVGMPGAG